MTLNKTKKKRSTTEIALNARTKRIEEIVLKNIFFAIQFQIWTVSLIQNEI
jgi:hypothetical protein